MLSKNSPEYIYKKNKFIQNPLSLLYLLRSGTLEAYITFLSRLKRVLEVLLCQHVECRLRFDLDLLNSIKSSFLQLDFHPQEEIKIAGD